MVAGGDVEQAAGLYQAITDLLLAEGEVPRATDTVQAENTQPLQTIVEEKPEILQPEEISEENMGRLSDTTVKEVDSDESVTAQLKNIQKLLKQGLDTKDVHLLHRILQDSKVTELPGKLLLDSWSLRPEDVECSGEGGTAVPEAGGAG